MGSARDSGGGRRRFFSGVHDESYSDALYPITLCPLMRQVGCKPQPYVVSRPLSRRVAQVWFDAFTHTLEIVRAIPFGQHRGEAATEGREPSHQIPGQRRGPRDQRDIAHVKASGGKSPTVVLDRRKVPGVGGLAIISAAVELLSIMPARHRERYSSSIRKLPP